MECCYLKKKIQMGLFGFLFGGSSKVDLREVVSRGATIVDVRTPQEYAAGSIKGAINIPVAALQHKLSAVSKKKPVIVYCASGARSASAKAILERNGFQEVYNGGGFSSLLRRLNG